MSVRRSLKLLISLIAVATALAVLPLAPAALASTTQLAMFQDNGVLADPGPMLLQLRSLGVEVVRIDVTWDSLAPKPNSRRMPKGFNGLDPAAYSAAKWAPYDAVVRDAQNDGMQLDFLLTGGAPRWATLPGEPPGGQPDWKPSPSDYGTFVHAVATRYSGSYTPPGSASPLPRVRFWELWNEPNFGPDLAPQASNDSRVATAPDEYRALLDYGWAALQHTGHGGDTILIGSLAPRGLSGGVSPGAPQGFPGFFSTTKPFIFMRDLYCVNSSYRELRGAAAREIGCPTTAAASARFRAQNPGLFDASGFAIHPYPFNTPPTVAFERDPNDIEYSRIPQFESALDRLTSIYGSTRRLSIYNTEYGYITDPPITALVNRSGVIGHYVSPATAARYLNWAEYIAYTNPRIATTMQYQLQDASVKDSNFATGLILPDGKRKATYNAYRLPLYLPTNTTTPGKALLVWGGVRPAWYAHADTHAAQSVAIQFQRGSKGSFQTIRTLPVTGPRGYFEAMVTFPASGRLRLAWTYPASDPLFPASVRGETVHSRLVSVTVR